jgi:transcriptional regulator with XRE-family HTH domain
MEYRDIGENIRKYRKRLDLTQEELADRIGITWEMISRYERGESSPMNKLPKISEALGIPITELIDDKLNNLCEVPLFIKAPTDMNFDKENTTLFYSCPKWLLKRDPAVFAITTDIINKNSSISSDPGYLFISPNSEMNRSNLVLTNNSRRLNIEKFTDNRGDVIGRIMMQEIIFIK